MTLRRKTFFIQITFFLILLVLLDLTFTGLLRKTAGQLDRQRLEHSVERVEEALNGEARALYSISEFWANSDAVWDFMRGNNPDYPSTALNRKIISMLSVSSMIFFDNNLQVVIARDYSAEDDPSQPEEEFKSIITNNPQNRAKLANIPVTGISGMANIAGKPVQFSIQPVFNSKMDKERAGYLLMTRTVSSRQIERLSRQLGIAFTIEPADKGDSPHTVTSGYSSEGYISVRRLIKDINGNPAFWIAGVSTKGDIASAERQIQYMFLLFAIVGLAFCVLSDRIGKRLIWDRLTRLQQELRYAKDSDLAEVRAAGGNDELSELARIINETFAYMDFAKEHKQKLDEITIMVYERFSLAGNRLCYKTLEEIATAFTPRDENFRGSIVRMADKTAEFARQMKADEEDCLYAYLGALFSRIGLLGIPYAARRRKWELSPQDLRDYQKYPVFSREFMESVELLRPAAAVAFAWKENWDGSGFPRGLSGNAILFEARIFAVVNEWNELTRNWHGRKLPTEEEVKAKLRERAGNRLDPNLVEAFIKFLYEESGGIDNGDN